MELDDEVGREGVPESRDQEGPSRKRPELGDAVLLVGTRVREMPDLRERREEIRRTKGWGWSGAEQGARSQEERSHLALLRVDRPEPRNVGMPAPRAQRNRSCPGIVESVRAGAGDHFSPHGPAHRFTRGKVGVRFARPVRPVPLGAHLAVEKRLLVGKKKASTAAEAPATAA